MTNDDRILDLLESIDSTLKEMYNTLKRVLPEDESIDEDDDN